jgi:hypothetical protein
VLSGGLGGDTITQEVYVSQSQSIECPPTCGLYVTPVAPPTAIPYTPPTVNVFPQSVQEIEANRETLVTVVVLVVLCLLAAFVWTVGSRRDRVRRELQQRDTEIIERGES